MKMGSEPATRIQEIIARLRQAHPDAHCALNYETPWQLLVATILSAQCTDERVNAVTPALFARYQTVADFAVADPESLAAAIRPTGFFRQKARFIQSSARTIVAEYGGEVPATMPELLRLKGVARKTANVVLGEIFGKAEGIVVDTHVKRLAGRLALTPETDPVRIERDLMALVPPADWIDISHLLIFHGRRVCGARRPDCPACTLAPLCPSATI